MEKNKFEDDGRIIADMSYTEKMTWSDRYSVFNRASKSSADVTTKIANTEMSNSESRKFMFSAMLAGLAVAMVFIVVFFVFILFCIYIWF